MSRLSAIFSKFPAFGDVVSRVKSNTNVQKSLTDMIDGIATEGLKHAEGNALATLFFEQLKANKEKLVGAAVAHTPAEEHVAPEVVAEAKAAG